MNIFRTCQANEFGEVAQDIQDNGWEIHQITPFSVGNVPLFFFWLIGEGPNKQEDLPDNVVSMAKWKEQIGKVKSMLNHPSNGGPGPEDMTS